MATIVKSRAARWTLGIVLGLIGLLVALMVVAALFDWNKARGWIGDKVKERTGRELVIGGDLRVRPFSFHPKVHAEQVTLANAPWGEKTPMIDADAIDFSISLPALIVGRVVFPEVALGQASVLLQRDKEGRRNWVLNPDEEKTGEPAQIESLTINKGRLAFKDVMTDTNVAVNVQTTSDATYGVNLGAAGKVKGYAFKADAKGGGLLSLMNQTAPYPVKVNASVGEAAIGFEGTVSEIATLRAVDGQFTISGKNLSKLGDALRLSFPETAPYKVSGRLQREGEAWRFNGFRGTVGKSDLGGDFDVDMAAKRPTIRAKLHSTLLDIADLGGFLGGKPGEGQSAAPPGKVLPNEPINLDKLRRVDAHVTLKATKFRNRDKLPIDHLDAKLDLEDGLLRFDPVRFGVADGSVNTKIAVNARQDKVAVDSDTSFRQLHINKLVPGTDLLDQSFGAVNGRVQLKGAGNSTGAMLGTSNGQVNLFSTGGQISNLVLEFAGVDIAEIVKFWAGGDRQAELRCAVAAFNVQNGLARSEVFIIDTDDTFFGGQGTISLKDEKIDLKVTPLPKDMSPVSLRGPLYVRGTFAKPAVGVEKTTLIARAGAAVLAGLINPLAAILPLIETGPGKDKEAPCGDLIQNLEAMSGVKATPKEKKQAQAARDEAAATKKSEKSAPADREAAPAPPKKPAQVGAAKAGAERTASR